MADVRMGKTPKGRILGAVSDYERWNANGRLLRRLIRRRRPSLPLPRSLSAKLGEFESVTPPFPLHGSPALTLLKTLQPPPRPSLAPAGGIS